MLCNNCPVQNICLDKADIEEVILILFMVNLLMSAPDAAVETAAKIMASMDIDRDPHFDDLGRSGDYELDPRALDHLQQEMGTEGFSVLQARPTELH